MKSESITVSPSGLIVQRLVSTWDPKAIEDVIVVVVTDDLEAAIATLDVIDDLEADLEDADDLPLLTVDDLHHHITPDEADPDKHERSTRDFLIALIFYLRLILLNPVLQTNSSVAHTLRLNLEKLKCIWNFFYRRKSDYSNY